MLTLVTPVFNPEIHEFDLCISSVLAQSVSAWEWILVDDGSSVVDHFQRIEDLSSDSRVQFIKSEVNLGISSATNVAIDRASGDFVAFLDQDDMLQVNAVEVMLERIENDRSIDILYSDEDKILDGNIFASPFFKPNWSPERFRHQNYLNHLTVIRRSLIEEVGGLRSEFDGSQDYDLLLRASELARKIVHVPEVLYHWRASSGSVASTPLAKPRAHDAAVLAVQEHLDRVGISGTASLLDNFYIGVNREPVATPPVSIIIPTNGATRRVAWQLTCLIENCVESILTLTDYPDYEVIIVLDEDSSPYARNYLESHQDPRISVVEFSGPFNYSKKINVGVLKARGDVVLPLNDDTQVIESTWITDMVKFFDEGDVGAVAPVLLLEDGRIQSAGHFFNDGVHHVAPGAPAHETGPFGVLTFPSERSGVTFAAVALRREQFLAYGGLSERFPRSFNDVDFCNKLLADGYRIICNGQRALYHFESLTRDPKVEQDEVESLYRYWGSKLSSPDPYLPQFWRQMLGL